MSDRQSYKSDLSDERWALIEPVITAWKARHPSVSGHQGNDDMREELTPDGRVRAGIAEARELLAQPHAEYAAHRLGNGRQVSAVDTVPFALWCVCRSKSRRRRSQW